MFRPFAGQQSPTMGIVKEPSHMRAGRYMRQGHKDPNPHRLVLVGGGMAGKENRWASGTKVTKAVWEPDRLQQASKCGFGDC
jgi:hypothetical protein